jgi:DNA helicase-2/ATP-dependent DNA helicase PcrA
MTIATELPPTLDKIDIPFKISAGPGAGKTTWLVSHVQNVLKNSDKLGKTQKVACITYTRMGADTVDRKTKKITGTDRLDIGTIHSFLYRNVIKPFSYLISKDDNGNILFSTSELAGHTENRPSYDRISSWISRIGTTYSYLYDQKKPDSKGNTNLSKTAKLLKEFEWVFDGSELKGKLRKNNFPDLKFPSTKMLDYKKACWSKGIMHHEDVLYFTHFIFKRSPRIVEFVANKFPYLFLDEFQDTNPLQTWIVSEIAKKGTVVGVIGDPAQAIFEFAGARRKDFFNFNLPAMQNFKKSHNYRSTVTIINFLKQFRDDIEQKPKENAELGDNVLMLVADTKAATSFITSLNNEDFAILCRSNSDIYKLKSLLKTNEGSNLVNLLYTQDSVHKRAAFIHSLVKAYDFNKNHDFKEAVNEIKKYLNYNINDGFQKRKIAIDILNYLNNNTDKSVGEIYKYLHTVAKNYSAGLTGLSKLKEVHHKPLNEFLPFISQQSKITSKIRTIHQSKGGEFTNVLIHLNDKTNKNGTVSKKLENILEDYLINAKLNIALDNKIGEETRLLYVACSRAISRLVINVPRLSPEDEIKMNNLGVMVQRNF